MMERNPLDETAEESIERFIKGAFRIGEADAVFENVGTKLKLPLSLDKIEEILSDCMGDEASLEEALDALISA